MRTAKEVDTLRLRTMDAYGRELDSFEIQTRRYKRRSGGLDFRLIGPSIQRTVVSKRHTVFSHVEIIIPMLENLGLPIRPRLSTSHAYTQLEKGGSITFTVPRTVLTMN